MQANSEHISYYYLLQFGRKYLFLRGFLYFEREVRLSVAQLIRETLERRYLSMAHLLISMGLSRISGAILKAACTCGVFR